MAGLRISSQPNIGRRSRRKASKSPRASSRAGRRRRSEGRGEAGQSPSPSTSPDATPLPDAVTPLGGRLIHRLFNLVERHPNADGTYHEEKFVLPAEQGVFLFRLSFLSLFAGLVALYRGYNDLAIVPLGVFATSVLYWHHPTHGWRRSVDICYVQGALWFQIYRAIEAEHRSLYYLITSIGMTSFIFSSYLLHKKNMVWESTIFHGLVHVLGNVANVVLYLGHVPA